MLSVHVVCVLMTAAGGDAQADLSSHTRCSIVAVSLTAKYINTGTNTCTQTALLQNIICLCPVVTCC